LFPAVSVSMFPVTQIFGPKASLLSQLLACLVIPGCLLAREESQGAGRQLPHRVPQTVWEAPLPDFSETAYARAVEAIFGAYEAAGGARLTPGERGRVGLKVYTNSGVGLATPIPLTRAVIDALVDRGYAREDIFLVDLHERNLRKAGYLPPLSRGGDTFEGSPVIALETEERYDAEWFYDSPLPAFGSAARDFERSRNRGRGGQGSLAPGLGSGPDEPGSANGGGASAETGAGEPGSEGFGSGYRPADRKSLLPIPLLFEADFWINLPAVTDHRATAINGALVNATLWNVSNHRRFFTSPPTAPAAAAEIAAIPELNERWALTLMSLERFQFIGGPSFNSLYTRSEPKLWASTNPVVLDAMILEKINTARRAETFGALNPRPPLLDYAQRLDLGTLDPERVEVVRLNGRKPR
jgi:hypothetical protein